MSGAALSLNGLTSGYKGVTVIHDISLEVASGEVVAVLGKNGMGKSTLLRTIMGFVTKKAGSVAFHGTDISHLPPYQIARLGIGFVAQEQALFQDLSVGENIRLAVRSRPMPDAFASVAHAFPLLLERLAQPAGTLSGGEQKMLLMARALATGASLMLVDEISEGLQPTMVKRIASVIAATRTQGRSFLIVEQNLDFALGIADRFFVVQRGEVVLAGNSADQGAREAIAAHLRV